MKVRWENRDDTLHTVTSGTPQGGNSGMQFDSSYLAAGGSFDVKFISSGNYNYYCTPSIYERKESRKIIDFVSS